MLVLNFYRKHSHVGQSKLWHVYITVRVYNIYKHFPYLNSAMDHVRYRRYTRSSHGMGIIRKISCRARSSSGITQQFASAHWCLMICPVQLVCCRLSSDCVYYMTYLTSRCSLDQNKSYRSSTMSITWLVLAGSQFAAMMDPSACGDVVAHEELCEMVWPDLLICQQSKYS